MHIDTIINGKSYNYICLGHTRQYCISHIICRTIRKICIRIPCRAVYHVPIEPVRMALLWVYIARGGVFLIAISAVGVAVQTAYIGNYIYYATPEIQRRTLIVVALVDVCIFVSILLLTLLLVSSIPIRHAVVGWSCVAITVACFAAPLGILWQVIHTRSVEFMPFPLSLALLVTAALWLAYGLATDYIYIQIPNVVGIALGAIQILVYFYYGYLYPGFQHIAFLWGLAIVLLFGRIHLLQKGEEAVKTVNTMGFRVFSNKH